MFNREPEDFGTYRKPLAEEVYNPETARIDEKIFAIEEEMAFDELCGTEKKFIRAMRRAKKMEKLGQLKAARIAKEARGW